MCLMLVCSRNCVTMAFKVPSIDRTNGLKKLLQWRLCMCWLFSCQLLLTSQGTVKVVGLEFLSAVYEETIVFWDVTLYGS
jgi:hypothetical protein